MLKIVLPIKNGSNLLRQFNQSGLYLKRRYITRSRKVSKDFSSTN